MGDPFLNEPKLLDQRSEKRITIAQRPSELSLSLSLAAALQFLLRNYFIRTPIFLCAAFHFYINIRLEEPRRLASTLRDELRLS